MQETAFFVFHSIQLSPNCDAASKWCKIHGASAHTTSRQDVRRTKALKSIFFLVRGVNNLAQQLSRIGVLHLCGFAIYPELLHC